MELYKRTVKRMGGGGMTHHCEVCPECVVLFDDAGYHGSVPDPHSETCKHCPYADDTEAEE